MNSATTDFVHHAAPAQSRTGGEVLVDQLMLHGADTLFCVPGESFLGLLDGLYARSPGIKVITTRHEAGAANMADAYGKLTGRPGLCAVTRGPGATNACNGLHTAFQDSTPMILLVGQVGRKFLDREAFQEIDYRRMFSEMAKWIAQVDCAERIPEYVRRAFSVAMSGRPGPVVLVFPEDVLVDNVVVSDAKPLGATVEAAPRPQDIEAFGRLLARAERPLLMVGGMTWTRDAVSGVMSFAQAHRIAVAAAFRSQDKFDNRHPNYVGVAGIGIDRNLFRRVRESDLFISVGARLDEMTTQGYTLLDVPTPAQTMVHVFPQAEELGRVYTCDLGIASTMGAFVSSLEGLAPQVGSRDSAWLSAAREDYLKFLKPTKTPGDVNISEIVAWLNDRLPDDAIITNGAGNYTAWVHRFFQYRAYGTQVAPTSGSMGYAVPAAVAAKIVSPDKMVLGVSGDGCFLMLGQELATAIQYSIPVILIVIDNGMLGTIRMHQERRYPGRVMATDLVNPDFAALARAYGAHAETVFRTDEFADAFERCVASGKPSLISVLVPKEAITPASTIEALRRR